MPIFPFFTSAVWPSHASSLPKVRLRLKVREWCSFMSVPTHSFCSTNIRSKPWANSQSVFFCCSPIDSYDRSFDPSMIDEEPASAFRTWAIGTSSFGIAVFLGMASLGAFFSCLVILAFVLDEYSTSVGPSDFSNFSFLSLIRSQTLHSSEMQFSMEWPGFPEW